MNIVVLAGGISTEREVSIVSGTGVCKALRSKGHRAILVDVFCGDTRVSAEDLAALDRVCDRKAAVRGSEAPEQVSPGAVSESEQVFPEAASEPEQTSPGAVSEPEQVSPDAAAALSRMFPEEYDVDAAAVYIRSMNGQIEQIKASGRQFFGPGVLELCRAADVVFLALHGADGEGGTVQAAFDLMRIPYTGSGHLGSAMAMDKNLSRQIFRECGVPIAAGMDLKKREMRKSSAENGIGLPCIVKPCCGGSSVGVVIARTEEEYQAALDTAFGYEEEVVVEQFIEGREFSAGIIDGKPYPVIEIAPLEGFYDYKNKYTAGSAVETCPAELSAGKTEEMQRYALLAYRALRLESYARVDFMMDTAGRLYCLEANTLPGMTPTSLLPQEARAVGIDYPELCELLIEVSLRRVRKHR